MTSSLEPPVVVIVGAGMAGLVAARALDRACRVIVLDKGRGLGGRLATRRIGDATFDHGAQFITTHTATFAELMQEVLDAGVAVPWFSGRIGPEGVMATDGHQRFRGTVSMNAIAKHLAHGLDVRTSSQVAACRASRDGQVSGWTIVMSDGSELHTDAVITTAPVPQTLALLKNGSVTLSAGDRAALKAIEYDPCLALMAVLDGPSGLSGAGAIDPISGPIDWIADNAVKGISSVPAVTIHATAQFSVDEWESPDSEIESALLSAAGLDAQQIDGGVQVQRWRFARPSVVHPERHLMLEGFAPFVCAGDAFGGAKVEGAALSGLAAAEAIVAVLGLDS